MSDGKFYTFRFGKNDFQKKLSLGYLKNFSDEIQINLISKSELNYDSDEIDFNTFQQYIDFVIYLTPPDINNDNISQFIRLSQDTGSIVVQNYFRKYLDKLGIQHSLLFKLNNDENEDKSLIEEKISSNLDKYIDQCQNELSRTKITNLSNIFFHKNRKLLNQDAAYDFIVKLGESKKEPNYFLLLRSLDGSLISEEHLNDALLNLESHFGFLPKTPNNFLKKLKEKTDEIETKFDEIDQQNKLILKKFSNIEEKQPASDQKIDEFDQKIDHDDQQNKNEQEMKKNDEEKQITFRYFKSYDLIEITINMKSTDHFNTIIEQEFDIHDFLLSYKDILLDPYFTLSDYYIPNHSILYVYTSDLHFFIRTNDQNYIMYNPLGHPFSSFLHNLDYFYFYEFHFENKLKFFYNNQEIKDFDDCKIETGSVILCSPPLAFVRICNFEDKNFVEHLPVILTEKIAEQIKEKRNTTINEIILFCNGERLDLNKTFQDYSITDGSEIYRFIKYKELYLEFKEIDLKLTISPNCLIKDIKLRIQKIKGIQIDEQKLFLEYEELNDYNPLYIYSNKTSKIRFYHFKKGSKLIYLTFYDQFDYYKFVIFLNDNEELPIQNLKQKFYLNKNIPPVPINIMLNNQVLDDKKVLQNYISSLESENKLNFDVQYDCLNSEGIYEIFVHYYGILEKIVILNVKPNTYVYEIKLLMASKKKLPIDCRLIYSGRQLEDEKTLQDYNINRDATLHLLGRLRG